MRHEVILPHPNGPYNLNKAFGYIVHLMTDLFFYTLVVNKLYEIPFANVYPASLKIQEIEDPLMLKIRYLDKLVDELAKGRPMEKILRS